MAARARIELHVLLDDLLQDAFPVVTGGQVEQVLDRGRVIIFLASMGKPPPVITRNGLTLSAAGLHSDGDC